MTKVDKFGDLDIYDFAGCYIIQRGDERVGGLYSRIDDARQEAIRIRREYLGIKPRLNELNNVMNNINVTIRDLVTHVDKDVQCVAESEATYARVADSMNKLLDELRKVEA